MGATTYSKVFISFLEKPGPKLPYFEGGKKGVEITIFRPKAFCQYMKEFLFIYLFIIIIILYFLKSSFSHMKHQKWCSQWVG